MKTYRLRSALWQALTVLAILVAMCHLDATSAVAYQGFIDDAVGPAQASQAETGVPASVTIAQAILESGWGDKHIGSANNYFGIKCQRNGTYFGKVATGCVLVDTQEWDGSKYISVKSYFRTYASMTDSFRDHGHFFLENARYAEAMKHTDDPDTFAREIHKAGYATGPNYADSLISLMKRYDLYRYDTSTPTKSPNVSYAFTLNPPGIALIGTQVRVTVGASDVGSGRAVTSVSVELDGRQLGTIPGSAGSVTWDTNGLSAGTYTVRFRASLDGWSASVNAHDTTYVLAPVPRPGPSRPATPQLVSPENNASLSQNASALFSWASNDGPPIEFLLEVQGGPYGTVGRWTAGRSFDVGIMSPGTYSWRVKARNVSGEGDWSERRTFTIQNAPAPTAVPTTPPSAGRPTLSNPGSGASLASNTDVTLSWNTSSNATQYKVEVWGGPYSLMTSCNWQSGTSCHIGTMWPGTMSWHVKARNASGQETDWSDTWTFTIQNAPAPTATAVSWKPSLSSPTNGALLPKSTDVTLRWNGLSGATQYRVELWGGVYSRMTPCNWQSGTSCHIGTMWPGNVLWRVQARDGSGHESAWSDEWNFTIQN